MEKRGEGEEEKKGSKQEELPTDTSPYLNYADLEDYKRKAYGAEGHQQPVERRAAAASKDAPTLSGADVAPAPTAPSFVDGQPVQRL